MCITKTESVSRRRQSLRPRLHVCALRQVQPYSGASIGSRASAWGRRDSSLPTSGRRLLHGHGWLRGDRQRRGGRLLHLRRGRLPLLALPVLRVGTLGSGGSWWSRQLGQRGVLDILQFILRHRPHRHQGPQHDVGNGLLGGARSTVHLQISRGVQPRRRQRWRQGHLRVLRLQPGLLDQHVLGRCRAGPRPARRRSKRAEVGPSMRRRCRPGRARKRTDAGGW
mmetsp:Transcript_58421/g.156177  ORF Transcript_58421/g.156177 Transcript_58421/m.156177 type:complete len:224 (+) Transcript_58421:629-1300(+)